MVRGECPSGDPGLDRRGFKRCDTSWSTSGDTGAGIRTPPNICVLSAEAQPRHLPVPLFLHPCNGKLQGPRVSRQAIHRWTVRMRRFHRRLISAHHFRPCLSLAHGTNRGTDRSDIGVTVGESAPPSSKGPWSVEQKACSSMDVPVRAFSQRSRVSVSAHRGNGDFIPSEAI